MLFDKQAMFWDGKTETTPGGVFSDSVDLQATGYLGQGNPMYFHCVAADMDKTNGDETYVVKLQDAAARAGNGNLTSPSDVPGSTLTFDRDAAGGAQLMSIALPATHNFKRYVAAVITVGGTTPSVKLTGGLSYHQDGTYPPTMYDDALTWTASS